MTRLCNRIVIVTSIDKRILIMFANFGLFFAIPNNFRKQVFSVEKNSFLFLRIINDFHPPITIWLDKETREWSISNCHHVENENLFIIWEGKFAKNNKKKHICHSRCLCMCLIRTVKSSLNNSCRYWPTNKHNIENIWLSSTHL